MSALEKSSADDTIPLPKMESEVHAARERLLDILSFYDTCASGNYQDSQLLSHDLIGGLEALAAQEKVNAWLGEHDPALTLSPTCDRG
jgi:hypothetical protein